MWRCGDDAMVDEVDSVDLGKLQIGVKVRWDDKEFEIVSSLDFWYGDIVDIVV
jgi:hypothetical protein